MDKEFVKIIIEVIATPVFIVLATYLLKIMQAKQQELSINNENKLYSKYLDMFIDTVRECVAATNQTYVDSLKNQNAFTKEAQEEAFNRTYQAVKAILTEETKDYLATAIGDFETYLKNSIEAEIKWNKE